MNCPIICVISGSRRKVDRNCAVTGYYVTSSGNSLSTFQATYRSHLQGSRIQLRVVVLVMLHCTKFHVVDTVRFS